MGVGMPADLKLHEFGRHLWGFFGEIPYQVGTSVLNKTFRDVDIRIILPDDRWDAMGFGPSDDVHRNPAWVSICLAFSSLGREMTGLPIDFQVQRMTEANRDYPGHRSAICNFLSFH